MLLGLCLVVAPSLPAGAATPLMSNLMSESQVSGHAADRASLIETNPEVVRRTRNSHRGSGRRDFVRYVFAAPAS
ncbi:MAG: hypothetical protein EA001_02460 [Oscillatoriales cyanobacterium]|nr:MAG: hypothetical protein EA001_02460 [Oscillatoriales cyanobacterium]